MAIPDRPMNFHGANLSLDELIALLTFMGEGQQRITAESLLAFRRVLVSCTDWTDEEIGRLTIADLPAVFRTIEGAEQDAAINPTTASG